MAIPTVQEQLDSVNQAIVRISQGGQSFTTPAGVNYTAADLAKLIAWRDQLRAEAQTASGDVAVPAGAGFVNFGISGAGGDRL